MKSEEDTIIRSEHEGGSAHASEESAEFVPGYQPERMTKITVPGLPEDASGMSAEALAKIPTLTEQVAHDGAKPAPEPKPAPKPAPKLAPEPVSDPVPIPVLVQEPAAESEPAMASADAPAQKHPHVDPAPAQTEPAQAEVRDLPQPEVMLEAQGAQDTSPEADSWLEQCQVRIDQLNEEIQQLNDRLDQLEQTTKV